MLRSEYLLHFCKSCYRDQNHIKQTFADRILYTCEGCKKTTVETVMPPKKEYTVVLIDEPGHNEDERRVVKVVLIVKSKPVGFGRGATAEETIVVQYPAWGKSHYTGSVALHPDNRAIGYIEAQEIAKVIDFALGKEKKAWHS